MRPNRPMIPALALALAVAALSGGCGGPEGRMTVYPVTGRVLLDGEPAEGVDVVFVPTAPLADRDADPPRGVVGADGTFRLSTYADGDGAPAGSYRVALIRSEFDESKRFELRKKGAKAAVDPFKATRDPQASGLTAEVKEGRNDLEPFQVRSASAN